MRVLYREDVVYISILQVGVLEILSRRREGEHKVRFFCYLQIMKGPKTWSKFAIAVYTQDCVRMRGETIGIKYQIWMSFKKCSQVKKDLPVLNSSNARGLRSKPLDLQGC